jgi:hypothetical protein
VLPNRVLYRSLAKIEQSIANQGPNKHGDN